MNNTSFTRLMICTAVIIVEFAIPSQASACECMPFVSIAEEYKSVNAVFLGEVTHVAIEYKPITSFLNKVYNILYPPPPYYSSDVFSGERVTFAVKSSWKNVSTTEVSLRSHDDCGYGYYPFSSGKDYLIYAYNHYNDPKSDLYVGFCTRTVEVSYAAEDLSYLNTLPTLPLTPVQNYAWLYYTGTAIFTLVLYLVFTSSRQKKKIAER
ncbi:MAG: hypothetical protein L0287_05510 [Anaerolineae bacterium]|nr:hypothetical protein [Anaerolineae bacterium]